MKTGTNYTILVLSMVLFAISFSCSNSKNSNGVNAYNQPVLNPDSLLRTAELHVGSNAKLSRLYLSKALNLLNNNNQSTDMARYHLIMGRNYFYSDQYLESINHLDSAISISSANTNIFNLAKGYSFLSATNACMGNYPVAIKNNLKAIDYYILLGDEQSVGSCYASMGSIYIQQKDYEKALEYLNQARFYSKVDTLSLTYANVLSLIGSVYFEKGDYLKAEEFIQKAYHLRIKNTNIRHLVSSLIQMAKLKIETGEVEEALEFLDEALNVYVELDEKMGMYNAYHAYTKAYIELNNFDRALFYAAKTNDMAELTQSKVLLAGSAFLKYEVFSALGNYEKALKHLMHHNDLNHQLISAEKNRLIVNMEHNFELENKTRDNELLAQKNKIQKQRITLQTFALTGLLIFMGFIVVFLRLKNKNLRQKKEILEKKNHLIYMENKVFEKDKKMLENDLELKNKELASRALALIQLNETLKNITVKMNDFPSDIQSGQKHIKGILKDIQLATHNNIWEEFDMAFSNVHKEFYDKLFEICPDLSPTDIKIAALLRLSLTTKEIAAITYKSESSVKTARHRLRNKLSLDKDDCLVAFLMKRT